ncbi:MAG TPA: serine/threonine-protein kinase, partial [Polyangiaceae bacterium]|nr:serine/threonine-protein kinase [Polyangiaceae bacterium]
MSSRAHQPADRDSGEPSADAIRMPGAGESGVTGVDDAVSGELPVSALVETSIVDAMGPPPPASVEDEDEAEEVVPEPDSVPPVVAAEPEPSLVARGASADELEGGASEPHASRSGEAGDEAVGERRVSRPPPLPTPEVGAEELAVSSAEMTADELQRAAAGARVGRAAFQPPWVDEVPDPVTPYEKRVSETVKVADLPPLEQLRGRVLANRYLAEEVAEHTACSISYRAYHLALDRAVTVRVLLRGLACSDEACHEVRRVAAAASVLESPFIATTLDFGVLSDGWPYLVSESFQGRTLSALLASDGKFVLRRVLHIGKQLAMGLAAAHGKGLVHGLLSPDNVLVVEPGSSAEVAKIVGFGVSRARGAAPETPRSGVFGVPFYVSPEQAACRPIDARSDLYSLGVMLYELMTGAPPFSDGDFAGVLCQHLDEDAPAPSSKLSSPGALAKALDAIIERCLRKEPERRYQTAAELADDLVRLEAAAARSKRRPMPEVQK